MIPYRQMCDILKGLTYKSITNNPFSLLSIEDWIVVSEADKGIMPYSSVRGSGTDCQPFRCEASKQAHRALKLLLLVGQKVHTLGSHKVA